MAPNDTENNSRAIGLLWICDLAMEPGILLRKIAVERKTADTGLKAIMPGMVSSPDFHAPAV